MIKPRTLEEDVQRFIGDRVFDHVSQKALEDPEFNRLSEVVMEATKLLKIAVGEKNAELFDRVDELMVRQNNRLLEMVYQQGLKDGNQLRKMLGANLNDGRVNTSTEL